MIRPTRRPRRRNDIDYSQISEQQVLAYSSTRRNLWTLFGGAFGGGKTVGGCRIWQYDISNYRDGIFVVLRKDLPRLRRSTRQSFMRFFDPGLIVDDFVYTLRTVNDNEIWFMAADARRDPNYEAIRGIEASAFFVDQIEEFPELLYQILPSRLRRKATHVGDGKPLDGYIYATCNPVPGPHWIKRKFISAQLPGHEFIRSLPFDNPFLPADYINQAFSTMSSESIRMYRDGDFDIDEPDFRILTTAEWNAVLAKTTAHGKPVAYGVDIGLGRPDPTVIVGIDEKATCWVERVISEYDTMVQADLLRPYVKEVKRQHGYVALDRSGLGKGIIDRLRQWEGKTNVYGLDFNSTDFLKDSDKDEFKNMRAKLYFRLRDDITTKARKIIYHAGLEEDMLATKYRPIDGKFQLVPKEEIAMILGRSPDYGDAAVLANDAFLKWQRQHFQTSEAPEYQPEYS